MADFAHSAEVTINASPEKIFGIVADPAKHIELAGSDELNKITIKPAAQVGMGTVISAEETVRVGTDSMNITADSIVVSYDPGKCFSFIVNPALPEPARRMQWWFRLSPEGSGTKVSHEVEVDWGDLQTDMVKGLRDSYEQIRAGIVREGMAKTVQNLKRMAE